MLGAVKSGVMKFAELKASREKWCKGEQDVGRNDINGVITVITDFRETYATHSLSAH